MRDALERQLAGVRARILRLDDEASMHRAMGRELLANRMDDERRSLEQLEASYLGNSMKDAKQ